MAKNEAKIQFTADCKDFNAQIQKANSTMQVLRAELKNNEVQMKATGASVETLEAKHKILSAQLDASKAKTEALTNKLEAAVRNFGEGSIEVDKWRTQLINAQTAQDKLQQAVDACSDEIIAQKNAMNQSEAAFEGITDKVARQQKELNDLKSEYVDVANRYGATSDEAKQLEDSIGQLSGELRESKTALSQAADRADELDRSLDSAGDAADGASDGFTVMKGVVADLASSAIQAAIGKLTEFIGYLGQLPAETMELRQSMSTLTTAFDSQNFSTETATNTWKQLYAVFGDDQTAVEAANHIARMSENQQDLNNWVDISTGLYATYQDAINPAGIAESAKETAACGKVTGQFADALNWSSEAATMFSKYMSEDVTTAEDAFNVALSECSNEQERQALITDTLTALYGDAAETYRETAGAQMEAKEATAEQMLAENNLAASIEPVTTAWTEMKTMLLEALAPAIEKITGLMTDALGWMQEHPTAVKAIAAAVAVLSAGLGALAIAWGVYTIAQWAANSAMLIPAAICAGIVLAIAAVVAIIVVMVEHWDWIKEKCSEVWESVKATFAKWGSWLNENVVQPVKEFFVGLWDDICKGASSAWEGVTSFFASVPGWFNENVTQPVLNFFKNLWDGIKSVWDGICDAVSTAWDFICNLVKVGVMLVGEIIQTAVEIITLPFRFIWENCKQYVFAAWEWIKTKVSAAINAVKNTITTVWNAVKNVFTTVWNAIKNVVGTAWTWIYNKISAVLNTAKTRITTVWNAIKSVTSTVFNAIRSVASTVWNAIASAVSNVVNAVKTKVTSVWNGIKSTTSSVFNSVKSVASSAWNGLKNTVSNVVNGVKSNVSSVWNSIKSTTSSVFNGVKSTVSSVWNSIKSTISNTINGARDAVKGAIDKMKSFFNFSWSLPKIKLPHFSITGKFSLNPPSIPKFSVSWYKDGAIFTKPTLFNTPYGMKGVGEAGAEAVLPIEKLEDYISGAIEKTQNAVNLNALASAIEDLANRPINLNVNGRTFAVATAGDSDSVNGFRSTLQGRGLAL